MNKLKFAIFSIIIILALYFVHFLTYTFVEPKAYDFMVKHSLTEKLPFDKKKQVYGSGDVILVMIDAKTAEKYRWPWKRETNCKLFEYFIKYSNNLQLVSLFHGQRYFSAVLASIITRITSPLP